jgi:hypothetical protein
VRVADITVPDILLSNHIPSVISVLGGVRPRDALNSVEELTDYERIQSLASGHVSRSIPSHSSNEAYKAAAKCLKFPALSQYFAVHT